MSSLLGLTGLGVLGLASPKPGVGGAPAGYAQRIDQDGIYRVDQNGVYRVAVAADAGLSLKAIAASKGIIFGSTTPEVLRTTSDTAILDVFNNYCDLYSAGVEFEGTRIQQVQGVFTFTQATQVIQRAIADGKRLVWSHLFYPAHDMNWVTTSTVTSANWQSKIDAHAEAVAAFLQTSDGLGGVYLDHFVRINVTNEIIDGFLTNPNGYRSNPWYTAAGPAYVTYMFQKSRALWPNMTLALGQDELETIPDGDGYFIQHAANFRAMLTEQLAAGAPIDCIDAQGHFRIDNGWNAASAKVEFEYIRSLGLGIAIGELDMRAGTARGVITAADTLQRQSDRIYQYLTWVLPMIRGHELIVWMLSDEFNTWADPSNPGAGPDPLQYPAMLDTEANSFATKPVYTAIRNALLAL